MMRLRRRRGPSAQAASRPAAACSSSPPKRVRISSSRRAPPAPHQRSMRRAIPCESSGCAPNQSPRTARASSIRGLLVSLEQLLELLRGLDRRGAELALVLLDRVLRGEGRLVVLAEAAHALPPRGRGSAERLEPPARHLQARAVSLAHDQRHARIHERKGMLTIAGAG